MKVGFRLLFVLAACIGMAFLVLPRPAEAQARTRGQVYLMRGIANVFSYGLDDLATKLRAEGIDATVYPFEDWPDLASKAVSWSKLHRHEPIVIIGHSLGADAAVHMAERMTSLGLAPSLIITFDPVGLDMVQESGGRFINYYQSDNGFGHALRAGPGFTGSIVNHDMQALAGVNHFNLEKSPLLHAQAVSLVKALLTRRADQSPPGLPSNRSPHAS